ncbi:MAG: alkaline phosphatase family protein [Planctomycetota bacterium]|jgi:hypothetical protein
MGRRFALALAALVAFASAGTAEGYRTQNVFVAVMDGVRWSETFGDPDRALIPHLDRLAAQGTLHTSFLNEGVTITRQGHATIATGSWQLCPNGGPRPTRPTLWEYARDELGWPQEACAVIFGKGRYSYAASSSFPGYAGRHPPTFEIAIGEGDLPDDVRVLDRVFAAMERDRPRLMFVNFGVTDHLGHSNRWARYTAAIVNCDAVLARLWQRIQKSPAYRNRTTLLVTNDHGRHSDRDQEPHGGFRAHGDACEGCRHVMLLALGPDIKRGFVSERKALQIDLAPTVGELLGFQTPLAEGRVLEEMLREPRGMNRKEARTPAARRARRLLELRQRDLLRTVADAQLARDPASLAPSPETALLLQGLERAFEITQDERHREFVRRWTAAHGAPEATATTGLEETTAEALLASWRTTKLTAPPMACDVDPRAVRVVHAHEALELCRLIDALESRPDDRTLRAALLIRQEMVADGLSEIGALWQDPAVSALSLAAALRLAAIRKMHPIRWSERRRAAGRRARRRPRPLWAHPDHFFRGCFPFSYERLLLEFDEAGHLGDGSPLADGAALLLLAEAHGLEMPWRLAAPPVRAERVAGLPRRPERGVTRIRIWWGGGATRTFDGRVEVEGGTLVRAVSQSFEGRDRFDAAKAAFTSQAGRPGDAVVLDVRGGPETVVHLRLEPGAVACSLRELREKGRLEHPGPEGHRIRMDVLWPRSP